jgi:hypothetical protein
MGKVWTGIKKWLVNWLSSRATRVLLVLFLLLVISVIFVGLDNTVGFGIGFLAATVLAIELTRRWRRIRNFVILFVASFFGSIFLSFLHEEVVYPLAGFIGGLPVVNSTPMNIYHDITSGIILFFGTAGVLVGFFGGIILAVSRLVALVNRKRVPRGT